MLRRKRRTGARWRLVFPRRMRLRSRQDDQARQQSKGAVEESTPGQKARQRSRCRALQSGFFLGLQNLPAFIHAGLQVEMMRSAQLAGILVFSVGRLLK